MLGEIFGFDGMIVLVVLVALLFGGAAIPKLARSLGSAKNEFEKGLDAGKRGSSSSIADGSVTYASHGSAAVHEQKLRVWRPVELTASGEKKAPNSCSPPLSG